MIALILSATTLAVLPALASASEAFLEKTPGLMTYTRVGPAAEALPDSTVLLAGGYRGTSPAEGTIASETAEIFDPVTGTFRLLEAQLSQPRWFARAAALPDGRVLIVGGISEGGYLASAEIYDPVAETFSPTGSMAVPRSEPAVAALPDGRILVVGGYEKAAPYNEALTSAEIYDPESGEFSPKTSALSERADSGASLLPNGKVLIAGGRTTGGSSADTAELFDPESETFSAIEGAGPCCDLSWEAAPLADGTVLLSGPTYLQLFHPDTNTFTDVLRPSIRTGTVAVPIPGGRVLIAAGRAVHSSASDYPHTGPGPFSDKQSLIFVPGTEAPGAPAAAGDGSGAGGTADLPMGGPNSSAEEAGWEAASASHGTPSATASRTTAAPKAKRACRNGKAAGKRQGARHTRSSCGKPGKRHRS